MTAGIDPVVVDLERRVAELLDTGPDSEADGGITFRRAQFDAGLAWVRFSPGCGGLGLPPQYQAVVDDLLEVSGVQSANLSNPIGYGNAAPILFEHGTDEHRSMLRACFSCEEVWCQLMSEPNAGSDVAGLATRAELHDDVWVVNGQKVWTSFAHIARWGLLVARSNPELPKHQGIVCLIVDMRAPGVEVRPIRMLNGKADFNEVFLTDVLVPDRDRLGSAGQGWAVVNSNLEGERMAFGARGRDDDPGELLLAAWLASDRADPVVRDRVMRAVSTMRIAALTVGRAAQLDASGRHRVHPAAVKVLSTEARQQVAAVEVDLHGAASMLYPDAGYAFERPITAGTAHGGPGARLLRVQAMTIEGGTSAVMRNVLGERALGLPRESRADLGVPWSDVPRTVQAWAERNRAEAARGA